MSLTLREAMKREGVENTRVAVCIGREGPKTYGVLFFELGEKGVVDVVLGSPGSGGPGIVMPFTGDPVSQETRASRLYQEYNVCGIEEIMAGVGGLCFYDGEQIREIQNLGYCLEEGRLYLVARRKEGSGNPVILF
ncbi:MAG: hypothetical protein N3E38_01015 [Candidatus Aenigmarchaeota archaeon]|nr:hypothetical protein [Candidatus Aenigmarchaeota archaeon]